MNPVSESWEAWERCLGKSSIIVEKAALANYEANASGISHTVAGVLRPRDTAEVQEVVRIAAAHRQTLHPISRGHNWGYGSRLPCERTGAVLLDLSRMGRIRNADAVSTSSPVAEIEPGVTQGQMADWIRDRELPLFLNVTGAGRATSLLGNSLERGVGYFGLRTSDLTDLEVVLGTGELLRTGPGALAPQAKSQFHYPYALGPSLDGLFYQSNLGVVTAAGFRLRHRRPCHATLLIRLRDTSAFAAYIDALGDLGRQGLVECVLHVGSPSRIRATLSPLVYRTLLTQGRSPGAALRTEVESLVAREFRETWTAVGPLFGTAKQVAAAHEAIHARMQALADVELLRDDAAAGASDPLTKAMLDPLVDLCHGNPTDGALDSPLWSVGLDPLKNPAEIDQTSAGIRFCSAALPLDGEIVAWAIAKEESVLKPFGFEANITLNLIDEKSALLITNFAFDKTQPTQASRAQHAVEAVFSAWETEKVYPYRLGVGEAGCFKPTPTFCRSLADLKQSFDPHNVFSGNKYAFSGRSHA